MKASSLLNPSTWMSRSKAGKARGFDLRNPFTWAARLPDGSGMAVRGGGPFGEDLSLGQRLGFPFCEYGGERLISHDGGGSVSGGSSILRGVGHDRDRLEWTLTEYKSGKRNEMTNAEPRVVRGGSWSSNQNVARTAYRDSYDPVNLFSYLGFRVVGGVPLSIALDSVRSDL